MNAIVEQMNIEPQPENALTVVERAQLALQTAEYEKSLRALVQDSAAIVEVKNKDGRAECHAAYMRLKNSRIGIENNADAATEDAKKFTKAVKAEKDRLIGIIDPEETRLKGLRDAWDEKVEAERQAAIEAERKRIADIHARIADIRNTPLLANGQASDAIKAMITALADLPIDDTFAEYRDMADEAKAHALKLLFEAHAKAQQNEAIAAQLAEERAELERQKKAAAEEARRVAEETRRNAEEARRQQAEIAAEAEHQRRMAEAQLQAMREQMAAEKAEMDRRAQELRDQAAALEAQQKAIDDAKQEKLRLADEIKQSFVMTVEAKPAPLFDVPEETVSATVTVTAVPVEPEPQSIAQVLPTKDDIINALCDRFEQSRDVVVYWLTALDFTTEM